MLFSKINRFKPKFKPIFWLRENVLIKKKLLNFKKKKWENLIRQSYQKFKFYKRFKPQDQAQYIVSKYPNKGNAYDRRFRNTLHHIKKISYVYGGVSKSYLKRTLKSLLQKNNQQFLKVFERRLDTTLYRAKFAISIEAARQLIVHGKIFINDKRVLKKSYLLKEGDLVSLDFSLVPFIKNNLSQVSIWPIPPKYLVINYKTMEFIFSDFNYNNIAINFTTNLNLEKVILNLAHK